ncbi:MAG: nucleoside hydrolase [Bryobacterales bacterium]|nr:nucleoside hydrolase [Bryobacterales bacterium]
MQAAAELPPPGVIFDADMGNSIDDALALALLYGFDGRDEIRVVAISVSKPNLNAARFTEAVRRFYMPGFAGKALPVGLAAEGPLPEDTAMLTQPLSRRDDEGEPLYPHGIGGVNDTADPAPLIRNALTAQHDGNAIVVLTGPATNLVRMLALPGAKELVAQKVRLLAVMGGAYPQGGPEYNIKLDIPAARKLFAEWPSPIVASGVEVGDQVLFPGSAVAGWPDRHPVGDAYKAYKPMPYDTPAWDMTAALHAVRPDKGYFDLSEPGTIRVHDDGRTEFAPSADGKHRYLICDPARREKVVSTLIEIAGAKPVERQRRRVPPPDPPKPKPVPEAKPPSAAP